MAEARSVWQIWEARFCRRRLMAEWVSHARSGGRTPNLFRATRDIYGNPPKFKPEEAFDIYRMSLNTRYQIDQLSSSSTCGIRRHLINLVSCVQRHPVYAVLLASYLKTTLRLEPS